MGSQGYLDEAEVMRTLLIWFFGIIATGTAGGLLASLVNPYGDTPFFGFVAGASAFACARLWIVPPRP